MESLYKIYRNTELSYIKFLKDITTEFNSTKEDKTANLEINISESNYDFHLFLKNSLIYSREMLRYRIKKIVGETGDLPGLKEEFDKNIWYYRKIIHQSIAPIIPGDVSYDSSVSLLYFFNNYLFIILFLKEFAEFNFFEFKKAIA